MIVVIPFFKGDVHLALDLLEWCATLDGRAPQSCLLIPDADIQWTTGLEVLGKAQEAFSKVTVAAPPTPYDAGWPAAANQMFLFAAEYVARELKEPWLWLEPDAIPLCSKWATILEDAYRVCGKPYMGAVITGELKGKPFPHMNGVGVYPADAFSVMAPVIRGTPLAFDVACVSVLLPQVADTPKIHCHWGKFAMPPIFVRQHVPGVENTVTQSFIRPEAVLFHRNKDGSLLDILREKRNGATEPRLQVVLPFCNKDARLAAKNLQWMAELGPRVSNKALLCFPKDTVASSVASMEHCARLVFSDVTRFVCPGTSTQAWPLGPNIAFQTTAHYMHAYGTAPWLWLEADAVPLCQGWLQRLETHYRQRGKSFFGPIVPGRGHMNGVAIYPKNMAARCPRAMAATSMAWDYVLGGEMGGDNFDASSLIQHCWGIVNRMPHPTDGPPAVFFTPAEVKAWVQPQAVLFHRCKDGTLIDRLRQMRRQ